MEGPSLGVHFTKLSYRGVHSERVNCIPSNEFSTCILMFFSLVPLKFRFQNDVAHVKSLLSSC